MKKEVNNAIRADTAKSNNLALPDAPIQRMKTPPIDSDQFKQIMGEPSRAVSPLDISNDGISNNDKIEIRSENPAMRTLKTRQPS